MISACATERGNAHYDPFLGPNSNFGVFGPIFKCDTNFSMYKLSGIHFWYRLTQMNPAMRTMTHVKNQTLTLLSVAQSLSVRLIFASAESQESKYYIGVCKQNALGPI